MLNVLTLGLHCQRKEVQLLTSWFRFLSVSIFWEESLNVVSASSLTISFPINVDGTVSNSFHNVWMECLSSLKVFSLLTWNKKMAKALKSIAYRVQRKYLLQFSIWQVVSTCVTSTSLRVFLTSQKKFWCAELIT